MLIVYMPACIPCIKHWHTRAIRNNMVKARKCWTPVFQWCCGQRMPPLESVGYFTEQLSRLCYCLEMRRGIWQLPCWNALKVSTSGLIGRWQAKTCLSRSQMGFGHTRHWKLFWRRLACRQLPTTWRSDSRQSPTLSSIGLSLIPVWVQSWDEAPASNNGGWNNRWIWMQRGCCCQQTS